jgi:threonine dehydratase
MLGQSATICVPETANPDKIQNIEAFGANVIRKGTSIEDAFAEASLVQKQTGAVFVHAFGSSICSD